MDDIKILIIADNYDFKKAGEVLLDFSDMLADYNLKFKEAVCLPDDSSDSIYKVLSYMLTGDSSAILVCGGLKEDLNITSEMVSNVLKKEMVKSKDALDLMKLVYESRGKSFKSSYEKSCCCPKNSFIIPNQNSGLSGFYLTEPVFFAAMPLEPDDAKAMFKNHVLGKMIGKLGISYFIKKRKYKLFGLKEKKFENRLKRISGKFADLKYSFEFSYGEIILSIYVKGITTQKLHDATKVIDDIVLTEFNNFIYGYDDDELETVCAGLLKKNRITVAIAESLTGGYISNKLTDPPGASAYFILSEIVYSNFAKINELGIDEDIIEKNGAVSSECAILMAENIRKKAYSDIGAAVTGFAGPKGESDNYPVGTVFIALSSDNIQEVRQYNFSGTRNEIKIYTAKMVLFWIYRLMAYAGADTGTDK